MSPKATRHGGASYPEGDPRHVPQQRDGEQVQLRDGDVVIPAAVARELGDLEEVRDVVNAAIEDYLAGGKEQAPGDEMNDSSVNGKLGGLEEVQSVGDDAEEIEERPRPDYSGWTKAQLNAELDRREIAHDPKANNLALIEELERSDGGSTISGVND